MGNRAVITTAPYKASNVGVYVHWNGGRASVEGFLLACKELGYRSPGSDPEYGMARFISAVCSFFPDGLSVGVGRCDQLDTEGDNGVYTIGGDWEIVDRLHCQPMHDEIDAKKTRAIADQILDSIKRLTDD